MRRNVEIADFVVMTNHVHGIITIGDNADAANNGARVRMVWMGSMVGARCIVPLPLTPLLTVWMMARKIRETIIKYNSNDQIIRVVW